MFKILVYTIIDTAGNKNLILRKRSYIHLSKWLDGRTTVWDKI